MSKKRRNEKKSLNGLWDHDLYAGCLNLVLVVFYALALVFNSIWGIESGRKSVSAGLVAALCRWQQISSTRRLGQRSRSIFQNFLFSYKAWFFYCQLYLRWFYLIEILNFFLTCLIGCDCRCFEYWVFWAASMPWRQFLLFF